MVEERLGQRLDAPREQSLSVDAKVARNDASEFEVSLFTDGQSGKGQRSLTNADCGKLAEAAALVIAIAIDPKRVEMLHSTATRASGAPQDDATPFATRLDNWDALAAGDAPTLRQPPPQTPKAIRMVGNYRLKGNVRFDSGLSRFSRWNFSAQALVGSGVLPTADLGGVATVGYFFTSNVELRVGAGGFWPQSISVEGTRSGSVNVGALWGHASLCTVPWHGSWQSLICTGVDVGALLAEGRNLENEHGASAPFAILIADAGYRFYLRPTFGLAAMVSAGIGVLRPEFGVLRDGVATQTYRPDVEVVRLALGGFWDVR